VKAIIFDCFGVLTADSWHEFRLSLPSVIQDEASDLNLQYCAGTLDKKQFLGSVSKLTGQAVESIEHIIDNQQDKNHPLLNYIVQLKSSYKIGLLSNVASSWIHDEFLNADEQKLFDDFVFSFQVGLTKPDLRIYKLAAKRLGVEPESCVFVDDTASYCAAAEQAGMKAVNYQNFGQMKNELSILLANPDN